MNLHGAILTAASNGPSYERATWMQVPLALLSLLNGIVAGLMGPALGGLLLLC